MISLLFLTLVVLAAVWAFGFEVRRYQIERFVIRPSKPTPRPLSILHLTDIHFSKPNVSLRQFFDQLSEIPCDFVFITGDMIDHDEGIEECLLNFKKLKPRLGIFTVFGNHDYLNYYPNDMFFHNFPGQRQPRLRNSSGKFQASLEAMGVRVLKNETIDLDCGGFSVLIHGLDDPTTGRANVRKALENFEPGKINFLLTHSIDAFLDIGNREIDFAFSGHSHGGQICLPGLGPLITHTMIGRGYASGIKELKGAICSISRGMGTSRFLKLRFFCPPEAVLITLDESGKHIPISVRKKPVL